MTTHTHPPQHGPDGDSHAADLADLLALDAALLGDWLGEAVEWVAAAVTGAPRLVVDLGCGTGAGSAALADQFPGATVVAVDRSPTMLARTDAAAGSRVRTLQADLADGWPDLAAADLVWAASSLHELPDPAGAMAEVHAHLVPGGLFAVVELDALPSFLPDAALEQRVHAVLDGVGWNHHPDWRPHLVGAGFEVVDQRTLTAMSAAGTPGTGAYADTSLRRMRSAVDDALSPEDLAALDRLLDPADPQALRHRDDLVLSSSRTVWTARRTGAPQSGQEWDARYASAGQVWSGQPNGVLVAETGDLPVGTALDVGCGEGADAVWLAGRGWQVTAIDVSVVALARADSAARTAGAAVRWLRSGLLDLPVETAGFDLVSVHYPALLRTPGRDAERSLVAAVAPGGTLLVVHHADVDAEVARAHGFDPEDYVQHDDVLAALGDGWRVEVAEVRPRADVGGSGGHHRNDVVLRARRLPADR